MMKRALILCGAVIAATLTPGPPAVQAATATCNGKPVTIVASEENREGTTGDDVVLIELNRDEFTSLDFDAGDGNDTICLTVPPGGSREDLQGWISAGRGDDTVISLLPPNANAGSTNVNLGPGSDTFTGTNTGESVEAETWWGENNDPDQNRRNLVGPQKDIISGAIWVYTTAPANRPNQDEITVTADKAYVHVSGPMGSDGLLDFTAAKKVSMWVPTPALLDRKAKRIVVNNRTRKVTSGNRTVLSWRGELQDFKFGGEAASGKIVQPRIDFHGNDRAEEVTFEDAQTGHLDLAGGNDTLYVDPYLVRSLPQVADGGAGADWLWVSSNCRDLVIRLDVRSRCDTSTGMVRGFERAGGDSRARVTVVGTDGSNMLGGSADDLRLVGRGGADELRVNNVHNAVLDGGRGPDRILANGRHFRAMGGPGNDYIRAGKNGFGKPKALRRVLLGGPGDDRLIGSPLKFAERLIGGPGRDIANGREGSRDYCLAEVRRQCEFPR